MSAQELRNLQRNMRERMVSPNRRTAPSTIIKAPPPPRPAPMPAPIPAPMPAPMPAPKPTRPRTTRKRRSTKSTKTTRQTKLDRELIRNMAEAGFAGQNRVAKEVRGGLSRFMNSSIATVFLLMSSGVLGYYLYTYMSANKRVCTKKECSVAVQFPQNPLVVVSNHINSVCTNTEKANKVKKIVEKTLKEINYKVLAKG